MKKQISKEISDLKKEALMLLGLKRKKSYSLEDLIEDLISAFRDPAKRMKNYLANKLGSNDPTSANIDSFKENLKRLLRKALNLKSIADFESGIKSQENKMRKAEEYYKPKLMQLGNKLKLQNYRLRLGIKQ